MRLIYDGDCGFCTRSANFAKQRVTNIDVVAWQSISDLGIYGLRAEDVQQRVYFIEHDTVYGGAAALAHCALYMGWQWKLFGRALLLPGVRFFAERVYAMVARNRHRLPGSTDACDISKAA